MSPDPCNKGRQRQAAKRLGSSPDPASTEQDGLEQAMILWGLYLHWWTSYVWAIVGSRTTSLKVQNLQRSVTQSHKKIAVCWLASLETGFPNVLQKVVLSVCLPVPVWSVIFYRNNSESTATVPLISTAYGDALVLFPTAMTNTLTKETQGRRRFVLLTVPGDSPPMCASQAIRSLKQSRAKHNKWMYTR